ncbi:MAG: cyclic nucleotide-binding domain-containing protein [Rhodospirillaceae bacterium]|nr:cyclic nucleotide-binding domain-containing protein [Rhodospirillaceae bacterium]
MRTVSKTFKDGEIIFTEGEPSTWAYELLEGKVEIYAHGDTTQGEPDLKLESTLAPGALFGEMGVLDASPRSTTARARGSVTVKAIPREEFLRQIESDPGTALKVMTKLARRMKGTGGSLIPAEVWRETAAKLPVPVLTAAGTDATPKPRRVSKPLPANLIGERKPNFVERILDTMVKDAGPRIGKKAKAPTPGDIQVLVALVRDDYENMQRKLVAEALNGIPGVRVETVDRDLAKFVPGLADATPAIGDEVTKRGVREGRRWLAERNADLLIWGKVESTGRNVELRFVGVSSSPGERPGRCTPLNALYLPIDFYNDWQPLLRAVVLAAVDPRSFAQGRILRSALPALAANAKAMGLDPSAAMEPFERAAILFSYGNAAAICAQLEHDRAWYHTAVEAWRAAVELYGNAETPVLGQLYQQLGLALQIIGERTNDTTRLEEAADAYRRALVHTSRRRQPVDWGLMKYRLGCVLYKIDLAVGDDNALREAIHACQSARQVFDRYLHPIRWAEISNTLAQILQVYGDNTKSAAVLQYAVKCCVAALQVRTPDTAPLQWASLQNTLGSALFLLAKHTGEWEYMRQSSDAFRYALEVYKDHGGGRLATVTERNLLRAERQVQAIAERQVVEPVWAQSFNIADETADELAPLFEGEGASSVSRIA